MTEPTRKELFAFIAPNLAIPAKVMAGLAKIFAFLSYSDKIVSVVTSLLDFGFKR